MINYRVRRGVSFVSRGIGIATLLTFMLLPFLTILSTSLKFERDLFTSPADLLPIRWAFTNYVHIFTKIPLLRHLLNTLIVAGATTVLNVLLAAPAAYSMARFKFRGRQLFGLGVLAMQMFSPMIIIIPTFRLMNTLNLLDTYFALILMNTAMTLPFSIWMLIGFFESVPVDLEDAGMIDGLSRMGALVRIIMPLTAPGLVTTAIFAFVTAWNEFIFALVLTTTNDIRPITMALYSWQHQNTVEWQYMLATAAVATVPTIILFAFVRRWMVSGLTAGAVK
jgi:multiple sugar transport system permease protein